MDELKEALKKVMTNEEIDKLLDSLEEEPYRALKVNSLKTTASFLASKFDLDKSIVEGTGFIYDKNEIPFGKHVYHQAGLYYIQEPSAMEVSSLIPIEEGDKVLDLCAAPGGKSTTIGMKLKGTGLLVSNDVGYNRASELSFNLERWGITNSLVTSMPSSYFASNFEGYFDKVVVDAPCSGLGMARKSELSKQDWTYNKTLKLAEVQKEIILDAYKCLRKGGIMLYSTCTFTKEEDEEVIEYLLSNTNAEIVPIPLKEGYQEGLLKGTIRLYPHKFKGEGHFACLIKCNDEHNASKKAPLKETNFHMVNYYRDWEKTNLNVRLEGHFVNFDTQLYFIKEPLFNLDKIKVLRVGICLGNVIKNRFEPSHSLALALNKNDFKQVVDLSSDSTDLKDYLKGMTLRSEYKKNYVLVCVDSYPLGLAKASEGILKNLLPKGLRN